MINTNTKLHIIVNTNKNEIPQWYIIRAETAKKALEDLIKEKQVPVSELDEWSIKNYDSLTEEIINRQPKEIVRFGGLE